MKILTAGVAKALVAEQRNALLTPSAPNNREGISFARSFDEIAGGASACAQSAQDSQKLTGDAMPLASSPEAHPKAIEMLLKANADVVPNTNGETVKETVTQSVEEAAADVRSSIVQSVGGAADTASAVVDDVETASLGGRETDVSKSADAGVNEKPVVPTEIAAGEKESEKTNADSMHGSVAPFVLQPVVSNGERFVVEKKKLLTTDKVDAVKPAKKEIKEKEHFSAATIDSEKNPDAIVTAGMRAMMTGAIPFVSSQTLEKTLESDSASVAQGQMAGIPGVQSAKSIPHGSVRGSAEKSTSEVLKDTGTAAVAGAGDGVVTVKRNEADSTKPASSVYTTSKWAEEKFHASAEVGAVPAAAGISDVTGAAAFPKVRVAAMNAALATGQEGGYSDAASAADGHLTLEATPTALEVGLTNGTHGWLKIRAEMSDGVVNASVSATTSAGQEMLHRELPSLTAYLQQERIEVGSVVLHTPAMGARDFSGGMESDAGGQTQHGKENSETRQSLTTVSNDIDSPSHSDLSGAAEIVAQSVYIGGGSWLSVRA